MESSIEQIESWALHFLRDALAKFNKTFKEFGLPAPSVAFDRLETNRLLKVERDYNVKVLQAEVAMAIESLNDGQHAAYDGVINAYATHHTKVIFIDGPGGMGKTYTENLILNVVHSRGDICTCCRLFRHCCTSALRRANGPFVPKDPDRIRSYVLMLYS